MKSFLRGALIQKQRDPIKAIVSALDCSEKTARNKLNSVTDFTLSEALIIKERYFNHDEYTVEQLFSEHQSNA